MRIYNKYNCIYLLFLLIPVFLFLSLDVQALSCLPRPLKYIAICQSGICQEGFEIKYIRYGEMCRTRPTVNENPENLQELFPFVAELTESDISTDGIYQINFNEAWLGQFRTYLELKEIDIDRERILEIPEGYPLEISLSKLSEDTSKSALQAYLTEWKTKEKAEHRRVFINILGGIVFFGFFALLAIGWPWLLFWRKPSERRELPRLLIKAFFLQLLLVIIILFLGIGLTYSLWGIGAFIAVAFLAVAIILELLYLIIYRGGKVVIQKLKR